MTQFGHLPAKHNINSFRVLAALGLLLGTSVALANPAESQKPDSDRPHRHGRQMGERLFERWDSDHDGRISIAQLPTRLQNHIRAIDLNRDGMLTREEFEKGKAQLKTLREKEFDKNGDGKVTEDERREAMRAHVVERFVEQDKNHDGFVDASEVPAPFWDHMKIADANSDSKLTLDELKTAFDEGKLRPPHRGPKSEGEFKAHAQERFNQQDKNRDGFLTEIEVAKPKWDHIKVADTNADNRITFEELTLAFKAGKLGRGPSDRANHGGHRRDK